MFDKPSYTWNNFKALLQCNPANYPHLQTPIKSRCASIDATCYFSHIVPIPQY